MSADPTKRTEPAPESSRAHQECVAMRDNAVKYCARVKFMIDAIEGLGCRVGPLDQFISCSQLDATKAGGFQTQAGAKGLPHIFLAENVGYGTRQVNTDITCRVNYCYDHSSDWLGRADFNARACPRV